MKLPNIVDDRSSYYDSEREDVFYDKNEHEKQSEEIEYDDYEHMDQSTILWNELGDDNSEP